MLQFFTLPVAALYNITSRYARCDKSFYMYIIVVYIGKKYDSIINSSQLRERKWYELDIEKLLERMSLREKIGQLAQYNGNLFLESGAEVTGPMTDLGLTPEDLCYVGSVLNFNCFEEVRRIQEDHLAADPNQIPVLFMMDVIHGYRTIYPIPLAMGASFDTELAAQCTRMAAREASAAGVHVTFTPMVDYVRDARWGRVLETCGEEPLLNGRMGAAQVRAFQGDDLRQLGTLATCVKHFAGYGGAEAGRDYNTVELSERLLREAYLPAYKDCIDAGATMLMPSFNSLNGVPSVANPWLMQKILRQEWQFDGVVISDYDAIGELLRHGIAADKKEAAKLAFANGCHIEMCSSAYIGHLQELLEEGVFTEAQLDEAVRKVLRLKERLGLFDDPYRGASSEAEKEVCLSGDHRTLAHRVAGECAVLLKNNGVLPLAKQIRKIAVIGPFADEHKIIGAWSCHGRPEESVSVKEGIENALPQAQVTVVRGCGNEWNDLDRSGFDGAVAAAREAEAVILCLGEPQSYSGEGNCRTDLDLPGVQNELAEAVIRANPNTAVLLFNGRPLAVRRLDEIAPAIVEMWFPGTEGGNAAADILFGQVNPSGKLTMTFPKTVGQCPIYYNHPETGRPKPVEQDDEQLTFCSSYIDCGNLPLYSFGFGLSYSNFVYEGLSLDRAELVPGGTIQATVTIHNDSSVAGKETVQLYMRDLVASVVRPVQQLIAYEKVSLGPGERRQVTFTVTEPMLRFWNAENQHVSEPGEFTLSTGYADHLLHTRRFILKET